MDNSFSNRGFKIAIIALLLVVIIFFLQTAMFHSGSDYSLVFAFVSLGIGIMSIIGLVNSLRGIREPNTAKKIIGLLINLGFVALFIFVIVANIADISRALD